MNRRLMFGLVFLVSLGPAAHLACSACDPCNSAIGHWEESHMEGENKVGVPQATSDLLWSLEDGWSSEATVTVCVGTTVHFKITGSDWDYCACEVGDPPNHYQPDFPFLYLWKCDGEDMQQGVVQYYHYTCDEAGTHTISVWGDGYTDSTVGTCASDGWTDLEKEVTVTAWGVTQVTPDESGKVMISTYQDDDYDLTEQTEDRKVRITATASPVLADWPVHFQTFDPDDESSYESDDDPDDNHDTSFRRGSLWVAPGFTMVPDSQVTDEDNNVIGIGVYTNAQGQAAVDLTVTDHCAGDNYVVRAAGCTAPTEDDPGTGALVAWKRVYVEEDQMYKFGSDLAADFTADGNSDPDTVTVVSSEGFGVGNAVLVFDSDHPDGENATITAINGNSLTLNADLANSYNAGYPRTNGRGAAVARPADGFWDADADTRVDDAFGTETDGSDGGCFVEFRFLTDGAGKVPYRPYLEGVQTRQDFSDVWFKHKDYPGKFNCFHLVAATRSSPDPENQLHGVSSFISNYNYLFVERIVEYYGTGVANADITAHELGHQWCASQVDWYHPSNVWCHLGQGTDYCLMSYQRSRTDQYSEFCHETPDHIDDVRDEGEPL